MNTNSPWAGLACALLVFCLVGPLACGRDVGQEQPAHVVDAGDVPATDPDVVPDVDPDPDVDPNVDPNIIPAGRRTVWDPGIPGGIPARTTTCATVTPDYASRHALTAFGLDGTGDAQPAIQYAIDHCPPGQVVILPAGTYRLTWGLGIGSGITLRGSGASRTRLRLFNESAWVIAIWPGWPTYHTVVDVVADAPKGATTIAVADASAFAIGDVVQIDQADDTSYLFYGGVPYLKRSPDGGYATAPSPRSQGQTVEVTGISGNVLSVSPQIHLGYTLAHAPQVFKPDQAYVKYAGVEELYVTGGTVGQISLLAAAYCWVKGVESDGTVAANPAPDGTLGQGSGMTGAHLALDRGCFRCVIRDSYFHHATHVVQGGGAYGITITEHSSDNLVENNIVYFMNKPFTLRASGGGNVIAYNYIDDAWTSMDPGLQETTLDLGHASFPFMELVEGNYSPQIATENVWGNSGWMTIFRNYASGKQERTNGHESYQIAAISIEAKARQMNVVGNVLGASEPLGVGGSLMVYEVTGNPPGQDQPAVFRIGHGVGAGDGSDDIGTYEDPADPGSTYANLLRAGNWDDVRGRIDSDPATVLPDSLYLDGKPSFFGEHPWPWVDPYGATKVNVLPAKQRFDAGTPAP